MRKTLDFIIAYSDEHGYTPTYSEMMAELGVRSKSRIFARVNALEERGYISRIPRSARAVTILKRPSPTVDEYRKALSDLLPIAEAWAKHCTTPSGPKPHHTEALRNARRILSGEP